jgi:hypothetical protein
MGQCAIWHNFTIVSGALAAALFYSEDKAGSCNNDSIIAFQGGTIGNLFAVHARTP